MRRSLAQMKAAGLKAVQTYVMWNFLSPKEGQYIFSRGRDTEKFLQLANDFGILVILQVGPYVCAEWEFGGLPWYLLRNGSIKLRSSDTNFLYHVHQWFDILLPKLKRFLSDNGGPIIMIQNENEYVSWPITLSLSELPSPCRGDLLGQSWGGPLQDEGHSGSHPHSFPGLY